MISRRSMNHRHNESRSDEQLAHSFRSQLHTRVQCSLVKLLNAVLTGFKKKTLLFRKIKYYKKYLQLNKKNNLFSKLLVSNY